ncbi:hypothetical protein IEO21_06852 [Rhodonia placenta]|uniref:Secreted protein n=1 Tax=Rhodonia placenta TaxID=104341 RepID=A0A8H7U077_9APHY|nr:hypothetical protein IEO21_06852 [Postia placenta]
MLVPPLLVLSSPLLASFLVPPAGASHEPTNPRCPSLSGPRPRPSALPRYRLPLPPHLSPAARRAVLSVPHLACDRASSS